MNCIKPSAKLYWNDDPLTHIEYCGRICYNSRDKMCPGSAEKFVKALVIRGHLSVLEHVGLVLTPEEKELQLYPEGLDKILERRGDRGLRARDLIEAGVEFGKLWSEGDFTRDTSLKTFEITCSRNTTHQLVRHRNLSFSERSFRYCKVNSWKEFEVVAPRGLSHDPTMAKAWEASLFGAYETYQNMLENGYSPDDARSVLPGCAATVIMATGTLKWWEEFLKLRYSPAASVDMVIISQQIYSQLKNDLEPLDDELHEQFGKADRYASR